MAAISQAALQYLVVDAGDWIAIYAAAVGTGTLAWQTKRQPHDPQIDAAGAVG